MSDTGVREVMADDTAEVMDERELWLRQRLVVMQAERSRDRRRQTWLERHLVSVYGQLEQAQWDVTFWQGVAFWGWVIALGIIAGLMM